MKIYFEVFRRLESFIISVAFCGIFFLSEGTVRSSSLLLVAANQEIDNNRKNNILAYILPLAIYRFNRCLKGTLWKKRNFGTLSLFWSNILCTLGAASCFWATSPSHVIVLWGVIFGTGYGMRGMLKLKTGSIHDEQPLPQWSTIILSGYVGCLITSPVLQILIEKFGFNGTCLLVSSAFFNSAAFAFAVSVLGKSKGAEYFGSQNHKLSKSSDDIYSIDLSKETSDATQNTSEKNSSDSNFISSNPDSWQKCLEEKYSFLSKSSSELHFSSASSSEVQPCGKQIETAESGCVSLDNLKNDLHELAEGTVIAIAENALKLSSKGINKEHMEEKLDATVDCSPSHQLQLMMQNSLDSETGLQDNSVQHGKVADLKSLPDQLNTNSDCLKTNSHLNSVSQKEESPSPTTGSSFIAKKLFETLSSSKLNKDCPERQNSLTTKIKSMENANKNCADDQNLDNLKPDIIMSNTGPKINTYKEVGEYKEKTGFYVTDLTEDNTESSHKLKADLNNECIKIREDMKGLDKVKVRIIEYTVDTETDTDWIEEMSRQPKKIFRRHANSVSGKYFENVDSNPSLDPAPSIQELSGFQRKLSHVKLAVDDICSKKHKFRNELLKNNHQKFAQLQEMITFISLLLIKASQGIIFPLIITVIVDLATSHGATYHNAKWSIVAYSGGCIFGHKGFGCLTPKNIPKAYISLAACFAGTGIVLLCILSSSTFAGFLCLTCSAGVLESSVKVLFHGLREDFSKRKNVEFVISTSNFVSVAMLLVIPFVIDLFGDCSESYDSLLHILITIAFVDSILCLTLSKAKGS